MNRLAKCTSDCKGEANLRHNLQAMLNRTGRQLNAKITWIPCPVRVVQGAKVKKQIVSWPVVHFSDWVRASVSHGGQLLLGGNHVTNIQGWHQLFREFWCNYKKCDPLHPIFHEVTESKRHMYVPFTHHGDEGRGRNKTPVLIESICPVISYKGIEFTNLSGIFVWSLFLWFLCRNMPKPND